MLLVETRIQQSISEDECFRLSAFPFGNVRLIALEPWQSVSIGIRRRRQGSQFHTLSRYLRSNILLSRREFVGRFSSANHATSPHVIGLLEE
jgi:hypothetical protein